MELTTILYIATGIILFVGISVASSAQWHFIDTIRKKESIISSIGLSASDFAKDALFNRKINVAVVRTDGVLTDHYSSKHKSIAISDDFYLSTSVVALGITAHEVGHAICDHEQNSTFQLHQTLSKLCHFLNRFFILIFITTIVFLILGEDFRTYYNIGLISSVIIIALSFILKLITVQNERNASKFGIKLLKEYGMTYKEIKIVKWVYAAALTTYIGAIFMPFVKILDFLGLILYNTIGRLFR